MGNNTRKRRVFTAEYRREAAHLVLDTGRPIVQVAGEIGVSQSLLGRWVAKERAAMGDYEPRGLSSDERFELDRLRKENVELRLDNEFLGKAAAFFAARQHGKSASR